MGKITVARDGAYYRALDGGGDAWGEELSPESFMERVRRRMFFVAAVASLKKAIVLECRPRDGPPMKVAFISGTSIVNSTLFSSWEVKSIDTKYGPVTYKTRGDHALI